MIASASKNHCFSKFLSLKPNPVCRTGCLGRGLPFLCSGGNDSSKMQALFNKANAGQLAGVEVDEEMFYCIADAIDGLVF